uniref:F-box domain-containing protein n=1 Tax=viral metagenome TaxID=1070528 RepID=A0A6C0F969_9ZZZZ|tara:strand:+ start:10228 stop:10683 length:456 start_codon:yes stop_codon:yes gene_type:complete
MNELPNDLFSKILSNLTINEIATLACTSKDMEFALFNTLHMLFFELNMTIQRILHAIETAREIQCTHKILFHKNNCVCKISIYFPHLFTFSVSNSTNINSQELMKYKHTKKCKLYYQSIRIFIENIKHNILQNVDVMNVMLFPESTRLKMY